MGAALSMFVLLSTSVFVIRLASVTLRLTGLTDATARFHALSALTGTRFTTSEAEAIVNYPVRRRIISLLMIIGNLGLVTLFATVIVSLVNTEREIGATIFGRTDGGLAQHRCSQARRRCAAKDLLVLEAFDDILKTA